MLSRSLCFVGCVPAQSKLLQKRFAGIVLWGNSFYNFYKALCIWLQMRQKILQNKMFAAIICNNFGQDSVVVVMGCDMGCGGWLNFGGLRLETAHLDPRDALFQFQRRWKREQSETRKMERHQNCPQLWNQVPQQVKEEVFQGEIISAPPLSPYFCPQGILRGRRRGCIFWSPPQQEFYTSPFCTPPTPGRVFSEMGRWGCVYIYIYVYRHIHICL